MEMTKNGKRFFLKARPDSGAVRQRQACFAQAEAKPVPPAVEISAAPLAPVAKARKPAAVPTAPKRKKLNYQERLALEGKHMVQFVVPAGLWTRFLVLRCENGRPGVPNARFIAWLEEQTREEPEKIPGAT